MRAFFAITLSIAAKQQVAALISALKPHAEPDSVRWTLPDNLHITLGFLPNIRESDVKKIVACVQTSLHDTQKFQLELHTPELLPSSTQPKFISLRPEPNEVLNYLANKVEQGIVAANYAIEKRPFRAHLTLGRFHHSAEQFHWKQITLPIIKKCWITEIVLFASNPTQNGSTYTQLARLPLSL